MKQVLAHLNKQYGEGSVYKLGDKPTTTFDVVSTGSLALDDALGTGGLARGRIVEIYGLELLSLSFFLSFLLSHSSSHSLFIIPFIILSIILDQAQKALERPH